MSYAISAVLYASPQGRFAKTVAYVNFWKLKLAIQLHVGFLWIIDKSYLKLEKDIALFTTEMPRQTSRYSYLDLFDEVENKLSSIDLLVRILLAGECNSLVRNLGGWHELYTNMRQTLDPKEPLARHGINPNCN